ncbi:hypothetical protein [Candidatus Lokiarchaeum ossiferum]|uniref:hypothetical protein n=1 Tax=Candidatus Lokiarchaeum ossiferum TaxID=2951803 RepID=UPI00352D153D
MIVWKIRNMNHSTGSLPSFNQFDIIVLDNTAFVSGFNLNLVTFQNPAIQMYITMDIYDEALKNPRSKQIIEIAEAQNILRIQNPTADSLNTVTTYATKTGDIGALSKPDQSIIGLCLDLKVDFAEKRIILMSDDYSVQNTCSALKIPIFKLHKKGIKKKIQWEIYCPQCFQVFPPNELGNLCDHCGAQLKRRRYRGKRRRI